MPCAHFAIGLCKCTPYRNEVTLLPDSPPPLWREPGNESENKTPCTLLRNTSRWYNMPRAYVAIGLCKCTPYIERIAPIAVSFQTKSLKLLSNRTLTTSSLHRSVLEEHQAFYSIDIIAINCQRLHATSD